MSAAEIDNRQRLLNLNVRIFHRNYKMWVATRSNKKRFRKKSRLDIGLKAGYDQRGVLGE